MVEFAYNNIKNASTNYMFFELNCSYHSCIFFWKRHKSSVSIKNGKKIIYWTKTANDYLLEKPWLYLKILETSS